jgi:negative regulator of sigma E activity
MSEQIREQVSAFLDGELPSSETELLLKRLTRDGELRESFGRYALIGEALRGSKHALLRKGFESRVNLAIDGELAPAAAPAMASRNARWWRPFAGAAVVVGVAVVAISAMQQRSSLVASAVTGGALVAQAGAGLAPPGAATPGSANHEALSYTVPAASSDLPVARPSARLTSYMFAHSRYSYGLGQRGVLADLLINDDDSAGTAREPAAPVPVRAAP